MLSVKFAVIAVAAITALLLPTTSIAQAPPSPDEVLRQALAKAGQDDLVGAVADLEELHEDGRATPRALAVTRRRVAGANPFGLGVASGDPGPDGVVLWTRLVVEPRRLWRRYLVGNPLFVARVVRERWGRR